MKVFRVQYHHYFRGKVCIEVQAETKEEAVEKAKEKNDDDYDYGGNVDRCSYKVVAQKELTKKKWKEVR